MKSFLLSIFVFAISFIRVDAQLTNGTIAPDFTVTDLNGNTHNLYSYLNAGKHVVLDFSATWCLPCWNYHNLHILSDLHDEYGPNGTNDIVVIFLEAENNNTNQCLYGPVGCVGPNGGTQGNWVAGTPYPIVDLSHIGQNAVRTAYQIGFFPTLYAINAYTKKTYLVGQASKAIWESWLFGSFEMDYSTTVDNSSPCPATASISVNVTAGRPPITYNWSNGANTATISNLLSGNYKCTISDANNFQFITPNYSIVSPPLINITTVDQDNVNCAGNGNGVIDINATGGNGNFGYLWSNGGTSKVATGLTPGDYTCTVTDLMGCQKVSPTYTITEPQALTSSANTTPATCSQANGIVTLLPFGGTSPYTYELGSTSQTFHTFTNLPGGSYNYTVLDNNGCTFTSNLTLASTQNPTVVTNAQGTITCVVPTGAVTGVGSTTGNNVAYQWSTTDGNIVSGQNDITAIVNQGGTYTLQVTSSGCTSSKTVVMPANTTQPQAIILPPSTLTCATNTITLDGSTSSSGSNMTYLWTNAGGTSLGTTPTVDVNTSGAYSLKVTNTTNGCSKTTNTSVPQDVTQPTIEVTNGLITCQNTSASICATTAPGVAVVWTVNGQSNPSTCVTVSSGGSYTATATGANGCNNTAVASVAVSNDVPQAEIATPAPLTCTTTQMSLQGTLVGNVADFEILWTTTNGNIVSGANTLTPVVDEAGDYAMKVTNTASGCIANKNTNVTEIINTPSGAFTYGLVGTNFSGNATSTSGTNTYAWDFGNGTTSTEANPTTTFQAGTFNVCLTVTNECGNNTVCQTLTVSGALTALVNVKDVTCFGQKNGEIKLSVGGGNAPYEYTWTGPNGFTSNQADLTNLGQGDYSVVVKDALGVEINQSATVSQPTAIESSSVNIVNDINNNGLGSVSIEVQGGTGTLTYEWNNGATTSTITNLVANGYECKVTDANGCTKNFGPYFVQNISSVDEATYVSKVSIHPNPAVQSVQLEVQFLEASKGKIRLHDAFGKEVYQTTYSGNISENIEVLNFAAGMYMISITSDEFVISRKLLIQK